MKTILLILLLPLNALGLPFGEGRDYFKQNHNKQIAVEGFIQDLKHHVMARDNFYTFKIVSEDKSIDVKIYTIKWLKRKNYFLCDDDDWIRIKGRFLFYPKGDVYGRMIIENKTRILRCTSPEDEGVEVEVNEYKEK